MNCEPKIALIEDQSEFIAQTKSYFNDKHQYQLVACYESAEDALQSEHLKFIDIILLDIGLPGKSGVVAIPELLHLNPQLSIIMLTVFEDETNLFNSLRFGASGYLLKSDCFIHLDAAIQQVVAGGMLFSLRMAQKVLNHFRGKLFQPTKLTKMERCVLILMKEGLSKKEIASKLILSYHTIDSHIRNIYKKLKVNSNIKAIQQAEKDNII